MLWLLKLINPIKAITKELVDWKVKQQNAETEQKRIESEENIKALQAQRDLLVAEQANFFTRIVRPLWAGAFIIYTYKVVVWDKVLGLGVTDPLDERMWWLMTIIAGSYFFFRGSEKLMRIWKT